MNDLIATLRPYLHQYGYWAVFGSILLEDFGLPMPGETLLIAGSLLASQGDMHIVRLLFIAWTAALIGDNIGYVIGRFAGRRLVLRYGHYALVNRRRLEHAEAFFLKYGGAVVIVARFLQVLRQLNGIAAGIAKMRWWRFLPYNALGAALWVGLWGILFYQLGRSAIRFGDVLNELGLYLPSGLAIAAVGLAIYLVVRRRK